MAFQPSLQGRVMRKNYEQRAGLKKGKGIDKCDSPLGVVYLVVASKDIHIRSGETREKCHGLVSVV